MYLELKNEGEEKKKKKKNNNNKWKHETFLF